MDRASPSETHEVSSNVVRAAGTTHGTDARTHFPPPRVNKLLKGAKVADLPIEQPTKFYLAINLKNAETLGLDILPALLVRADQLIE